MMYAAEEGWRGQAREYASRGGVETRCGLGGGRVVAPLLIFANTMEYPLKGAIGERETRRNWDTAIHVCRAVPGLLAQVLGLNPS